MERKHIGDLNTSNFFCKGCGMTRDSIDCPVCSHVVRPSEFSFPLPVVAIFVLGAVIVAVGAWFVSRI